MNLDDIKALPYMPLAAYHARPELGATTLKALDRDGPEVARAIYSGEVRFESSSLRLGSAVHAVAESEEAARKLIRVAPSDYKTSDSIKFGEWSAQQDAGTICLTQREADEAYQMGMAVDNAIKQHKPRHLKRFAEVSLFWDETLPDGSPIACKCRPDILLVDPYQKHVVNIDIKSCRDNGPRACRSAILRYGYHIQQPHYEAGIRSFFGPEWSVWTEFLFIRSNPAVPKFVRISDLDSNAAAGHWRMLLADWSRRTQANDWCDPVISDLGLGLWQADETDETEGE